jgi:hypothetical protein
MSRKSGGGAVPNQCINDPRKMLCLKISAASPPRRTFGGECARCFGSRPAPGKMLILNGEIIEICGSGGVACGVESDT